MLIENFADFGGILSGPVALLGFIFRMILSVSLIDELAKWNEPFCERFSSISFILGRFFIRIDDTFYCFTISK